MPSAGHQISDAKFIEKSVIKLRHSTTTKADIVSVSKLCKITQCCYSIFLKPVSWIENLPDWHILSLGEKLFSAPFQTNTFLILKLLTPHLHTLSASALQRPILCTDQTKRRYICCFSLSLWVGRQCSSLPLAMPLKPVERRLLGWLFHISLGEKQAGTYFNGLEALFFCLSRAVELTILTRLHLKYSQQMQPFQKCCY